jgi:hypothetical protein
MEFFRFEVMLAGFCPFFPILPISGVDDPTDFYLTQSFATLKLIA